MQAKAIYVEGSIYKHLLTLAFLGVVSLTSRFFIDALNVYFVGLLPHKVILISAIGVSQGYTLLYFAFCVSASITIGMRVGYLYGLGKFKEGKIVFTNLIFTFFVFSFPLAIMANLLAPYYFKALGVPPEIMAHAVVYTRIMLSACPVLMLAVTSNPGLAIIGRPHVGTLGMVVYSLLDAMITYTLMLHFNYGLVGLAIANVIGRSVLVLIVWYPLIHNRALFDKVKFYRLWYDLKKSLNLFLPTFVSQFATLLFVTIANTFLMKYDPAILAGYIAISKIAPLSYCFVFVLGGAFSTVFSQNLGAKNIPRLYESIRKTIILGSINVICVTIVLGIFKHNLISIFKVQPKAYDFFDTFIYINGYFYIFLTISNVFTGVLQNIRKAIYATIINLLRATVGSVFFLWLAQIYFGAKGILLGGCASSAVFAIILAITGLIMLKKALNNSAESVNHSKS